MNLMISLIRHGITRSGKEGRYLGLGDEMLLEEEASRIRTKASSGSYPSAQLVYSSSLLRCRESVSLIYPASPAIIMRELRAFDFGVFTGKQYHQLIRDQNFHKWAHADKLLPVSGGERPYDMVARSVHAFYEITREMLKKDIEHASVVTHREIILAILRRFHIPRSYYTDWQIDYGGGYVLEYNPDMTTARIVKSF